MKTFSSLLAFTVFLLISISLVSASSLYQENANSSSSSESYSEIVDGNWNSAKSFGNDLIYSQHNIYFNYTKPVGAISATYRLKDNEGVVREYAIPESCWAYSDNIQIMVLTMNYAGMGMGNSWYCKDNLVRSQYYSNWNNFRDFFTGYSYGGVVSIYEEAITWNILDPLPSSQFPVFLSGMPGNGDTISNFTIGATCSNTINLAFSRILVSLNSDFTNNVAGAKSNSESVSSDFSFLPAGTYYFKAICVNSSGSMGSTETIRIQFDKSPHPAFVLPTPPLPNNIVNSLRLNLTCSPTYSDIFQYSRVLVATNDLFTANVRAESSLTGNLFYDFLDLAEGTYYFKGFCVNSSGNAFSTDVRRIELDKTVPVSTLVLRYPDGSIYNGANTTSTISATLTCADLHTCTSYYRLNGGGATAYTSTFSISTIGTNILSYYSVDAAGNTESERSRIIIIGPTITECDDDSDCDEDNGESCESGVCVAECEHDSDCDDDEECDNGECVSDNSNDNPIYNAYCGNGICDSVRGETSQNCASDCNSNFGKVDISKPVLINSIKDNSLLGISKLGWFLIILAILIIIVLALLIFYVF